jgi:hypothetical protein
MTPHTERSYLMNDTPNRPTVEQAIAQTFVAIRGIDRIVTEAVEDGEEMSDGPHTQPNLQMQLEATGRLAGEALAAELAGKHSPEWLSKKASDTARRLTHRPFMAGLNKALGLPEDYCG